MRVWWITTTAQLRASSCGGDVRLHATNRLQFFVLIRVILLYHLLLGEARRFHGFHKACPAFSSFLLACPHKSRKICQVRRYPSAAASAYTPRPSRVPSTHPWQTTRSYCTVPEARAINPSLRTLRALRGAPHHSLILRRTSILLPNSFERGVLRFEGKLAGWDRARLRRELEGQGRSRRVLREGSSASVPASALAEAPPTGHLEKKVHFSLSQIWPRKDIGEATYGQ